jgi:hypothetical protein
LDALHGLSSMRESLISSEENAAVIASWKQFAHVK